MSCMYVAGTQVYGLGARRWTHVHPPGDITACNRVLLVSRMIYSYTKSYACYQHLHACWSKHACNMNVVVMYSACQENMHVTVRAKSILSVCCMDIMQSCAMCILVQCAFLSSCVYSWLSLYIVYQNACNLDPCAHPIARRRFSNYGVHYQ